MTAIAPVETPNVASLAAVIANCWIDAKFRSELAANPKRVLAEYGVAISHGVDVRVLVDEPRLINVVLPRRRDNDRAQPAPPQFHTFSEVRAYICARARGDAGFRRRFLAAPAAMVRSLGYALPDDVHVAAYEATDDTRYFVVPAEPSAPLSAVVQNEIDVLSGA